MSEPRPSFIRRTRRGRAVAPADRLRLVLRRRSGRVALALVLVAAAVQVSARADDRADAASRAWGERVAVWVATAPVAAGSLITAEVVTERLLPRVAVPDDAVDSSPTGRRTAVDLATGETIRAARLNGRGEIAAQLDPTEGALALTAAAPHLAPGDVVDLYALLTGDRVATAARVLRLDDGVPVVAIADDQVGAVVRTFTTGDVVAVLVG